MSDSENAAGQTPDREDPLPSVSSGPEWDREQGGLPAGVQVGHFKLERELGRGGMGIVYLGRDIKLDRLVALKSVPLAVKRNHQTWLRLQREAKLLAQLNHPNIATIHEQMEDEKGHTYLILEYVAGQTLSTYIAQGLRDLRETMDLGRQIADGLGAAHEQGVVHRDLKPGNIMLTPQNRVKILDFGLAKTLDRHQEASPGLVTKTGGVKGTIAYMSSEQIRGERVDRRTDLWSLGVVLFELLTGRRPSPNHACNAF